MRARSFTFAWNLATRHSLLGGLLVASAAAGCSSADTGSTSSEVFTMPAMPEPMASAVTEPVATEAPAAAPVGAVPPQAGSLQPTDGVIVESEIVETTHDDIEEMQCAGFSETANQVILPVDIIFVIDNSSSMTEEISEVQDRINGDFSEIIGASGLDYRVLMVSRYGDVNTAVGQSDHPVCVGAPLGASDCSVADTAPLANNPPLFYHYSSDVGSREPWCDLIDGFDAPDELGGTAADRDAGWTPLFPNGYSEALRPESFKHFVVITDDDSNCGQFGGVGGVRGGGGGGVAAGGSAQDFDDALLSLAPDYFGSADDRRYRWHSIVGMVEKTADAGGVPEPWLPEEPVQNEMCSGAGGDAVGPGVAFQELSVLTGGLRYPSCHTENFNAVFNAIAEGIVQGATLSCEWDIPMPPDGEVFDKDKVNVDFTPGGGTAETLGKVDSEAECGDQPGWYFDNEDAPNVVRACPASCNIFSQDGTASVSVVFGCETKLRIAR